VTSLLLGLRFALTGNRARLIVTSTALAFTVGILLAALGIGPALQTKSQRLDDRSRQTTTQVAAAQPVTLSTDADTYWRGQPLTVRRVTAIRGGVVPPGLHQLPGPGEVAVSPSLRDILRGRYSGELTSRVPGRISAVIADPGLAGPRELFAYVGVSVAAQRSGQHIAEQVSSYGSHRTKQPTPVRLQIAAGLGGLALLLPVLVLVATATRLSAASRDRRLSAVRLIGATPRQASLVAAGEALAFSAAGVVLGVLGFVSLRGTAARLLPLPDGLFAQDLRPNGVVLALVLLGVPVLAVLTSLFSLRRVVTSPLGVRREARVRRAGWVRLLPLAAGLLFLVEARAHRLAVANGTHHGPLLVLVGGGLTLLGLAVAGPAVSRLGGLVLGRMGGGVSSSLASERVAADPGASARVITGSVLVVFATAWLLAFLPSLKVTTSVPGDGAGQVLPAGTLRASGNGIDVTRLRSLPGVRHVLLIGMTFVAPLSYRPQDQSFTGAVVPLDVLSCRDLAAVLGRDPGCGTAQAHTLGPLTAGTGLASDGAPLGVPLQVVNDESRPGRRITLPPSPGQIVLTDRERAAGIFNGGLFLEPTFAGARQGEGRLFVTSDGSAATVERIRASLPPTTTSGAMTIEEQAAQTNRVYDGYVRAVVLGLVMAITVGAASLAVSTADSARERRRSTAALVAIGVPLRTLRRAVLLQMAAPMLTNVLLALGAAAAASTLYLDIYAGNGVARTPLPWTGWGLTGLAAVVAVVLATCATLPLVNAAGRPEALRTE